MILTKIIVNTTSDGADLVANILIQNGSNGATIVDKKDVVDYMAQFPKQCYSEDIISYYPSMTLVVGVIGKENEAQTIDRIRHDLLTLQKNAKVNVGELSFRTENVNDEHWQDIWLDYYNPYTVGKLKIFASWQKITKSLFKQPIILKPGAAFGTGQHPTTEACLKLLQTLQIKGKSVLDIGTGTGILGIAAIKLGAKSAYLTDIDDVAIESSKENGEINKVLDKLIIKKEDVVGNASVNADIVFLNINLEWALNYCEKLKLNIKNDGFAIISGILAEDKQKAIDYYIGKGYSIVSSILKDGWFTFVARVR